MTAKVQPTSPFNPIFSDSRNVSKFLARQDPLTILSAELGPKFLDYRRRWDLARTFKEIPPFPLHVDYELMSECNLRCPMCPMATRTCSAQGRLELSSVKALIDEGVEKGQFSIGFGGLWEPLLSKDLSEIISYARGKGIIDVMFNTNGLLLDSRTARDLIDSGLTRLMVSLDAVTQETYSTMRPGSNLKRVEANIMTFLAKRQEAKSRLPLLRLSFCLTSINQAELIPFLQKWENKVDFFSIQSYGRFDEKAPPLFPDSPPVSNPSGLCAQPFKRLLVRHNETVLPCCDLSGLKLTLGSAKSGLSQIWSSRTLADLRCALTSANSVNDLPQPCQKCQTKYQASH